MSDVVAIGAEELRALADALYPTLEWVLRDMAARLRAPDATVLSEYMRLYPEWAAELADFAMEASIDELMQAITGSPIRTLDELIMVVCARGAEEREEAKGRALAFAHAFWEARNGA